MAAVYLSNDENWEVAWEYFRRIDEEYTKSLVHDSIWLKWVLKQLMVRLVSKLNFQDASPLQVFGRYLQGSLDEEVYLALLQGFNRGKSIEDRGNFVGLSASNRAGALLEKMVFTGEKDENKLREIIERDDFKPDLTLAIACAVKGLSSIFLREMLEVKGLELSRFLLFGGRSSRLPLDHINIDSLKALLDAVVKIGEEKYFLSINCFTKDKVLLELVKQACLKTDRTIQIDGVSVWNHPRTAYYLFKTIEQNEALGSIITRNVYYDWFRDWIAPRDHALMSILGE